VPIKQKKKKKKKKKKKMMMMMMMMMKSVSQWIIELEILCLMMSAAGI